MSLIQTVKSALGITPNRDIKPEDKLLQKNLSELVESYFDIVESTQQTSLSSVDDGDGEKRIDTLLTWRTRSDVAYSLTATPDSTNSNKYSIEFIADGEHELALTETPEHAVEEVEVMFEDIT